MHRNPGFVAALLVTVCVAQSVAAQREETSREFARTLSVAEGQTLRVEHRHGDMDIRTHAARELRIQATIRVSADSRAAAEDLATRIQIDVTEAPTTIGIRTRYPSEQGRQRNLSYSVDYILTVPERMPVDVRNSFGNVSMTGLKADATVVNAHGTLNAQDGAGRYRLENSFGNIDVARMTGDVTVTGANGTISVATVSGDVSLTNRFGQVRANGIRGAALVANSNGQVDLNGAASATVTNSFGPVTVGAIEGDADVRNSNGKVTAQAIKGKADLRTTFGVLEFRDIGKSLSIVSSNGAITGTKVGGPANITGSFGQMDVRDVAGDASITNSNGGVRLADVRGSVMVRTTFGLVAVERTSAGLVVDNSNGGVQATAIRGGADVKTSFGPVMLRDVEGKVSVRNQNGAIDVALVATARACQDVLLTTSFSPIQLLLPDAGYVLTAKTSFGRIRSDVPISVTGAIGEGSLSGTIGAGGCALQLMNSNGDIQIMKAAGAR